jgi:hypothetical protein
MAPGETFDDRASRSPLVMKTRGGQEWQPQGKPEKTLIHDFPDKEAGKVIPCC